LRITWWIQNVWIILTRCIWYSFGIYDKDKENSSGNTYIIFRARALFFVGNSCLSTRELGRWVKNSETSELVPINRDKRILAYFFQDEQPQSCRWNSGRENKSIRGNEFEDKKLKIEKKSFGFYLFSLRRNVLEWWMRERFCLDFVLMKVRNNLNCCKYWILRRIRVPQDLPQQGDAYCCIKSR